MRQIQLTTYLGRPRIAFAALLGRRLKERSDLLLLWRLGAPQRHGMLRHWTHHSGRREPAPFRRLSHFRSTITRGIVEVAVQVHVVLRAMRVKDRRGRCSLVVSFQIGASRSDSEVPSVVVRLLASFDGRVRIVIGWLIFL